MDRWMDGWMVRLMVGWLDYECFARWLDIWMEVWMNGWIDGRMDE
jgi:hypothetical protein